MIFCHSTLPKVSSQLWPLCQEGWIALYGTVPIYDHHKFKACPFISSYNNFALESFGLAPGSVSLIASWIALSYSITPTRQLTSVINFEISTSATLPSNSFKISKILRISEAEPLVWLPSITLCIAAFKFIALRISPPSINFCISTSRLNNNVSNFALLSSESFSSNLKIGIIKNLWQYFNYS